MSTASSSDDPKPDPYLKVTIGEVDHNLFMSFGLLNKVSTLVGGVEAVPQLSFNPDMSAELIRLVLAKRGKRGDVVDPAEVEVDLENLTYETAEEIIDWAGAHVLDFFIRRFATSAQLFAAKAGKLAEVGSSLTSSGN